MTQTTDHPLKIGLEIHGYLNTKEKLFCMCATNPLPTEEDKPNSRICPICTGQPGSKPMAPNEEATKKFIAIALVLNSHIQHSGLVWQRKHYDWPDNPKGYQTTISGTHATVCSKGGHFKGITITEAHLEEDPAQWNPQTGGINYNRSGLPLIEIVTEPEFTSAEQVISWLKSLVLSLSYIKAIRKNAGIKVDVNISTYGERVEIKNVNSLEKIRRAIEYEITKQIENHKKGIIQTRQTLAYNENLGRTVTMREKEGAADYRFISDPDLAELIIDKETITKEKKDIPEMPEEKLEKLLHRYKVDTKNATILTSNLELVELFEEFADSGLNITKNLSWITIELLRILNYNKKTLDDADVNIQPKHLIELVQLVEKGNITVLKAKQIMNDFVPTSFSIQEKGDIETIAQEAIENLAKQVLEENTHIVQEYKEGKKTSINYLMGQVMKKSERRASPETTKKILEKLLEKNT